MAMPAATTNTKTGNHHTDLTTTIISTLTIMDCLNKMPTTVLDSTKRTAILKTLQKSTKIKPTMEGDYSAPKRPKITRKISSTDLGDFNYCVFN